MSSKRPLVHFVDFDQPEELRDFEEWSRRLDSKNFVLEFSNATARCARDLDDARMGEALRQRSASIRHRQTDIGTRWINIWRPEEQARLIQRIGRHYDFSTRLVASMCCKQKLSEQSLPLSQEHRRVTEIIEELMQPWRSKSRKPWAQRAARITHAISRKDSVLSETDGAPALQFLDLDHYRLVNDVWHFSSVDWGQHYLCIGFNSLYRVDREIDVDSYRPAGKRIWMWLVLTDDGTVVAIHENPFPRCITATAHQQKVVTAIRRNLRNILMQLSRGFDDRKLQNMLETIKLRSHLPTTAGTQAGTQTERNSGNDEDDDEGHINAQAPHVSEADAPSLLFYYLFDDWFTSYSLVARREHQYGVELDSLRDRMFRRAELEHVSRLHHYGRQLAVLKRIYNSYSIIIQRILDGPQIHTTPAPRPHAVAMQDSDLTDRAANSAVLLANRADGQGEDHGIHDSSGSPQVGAEGSMDYPTSSDEYGVTISVAAATRFRRLRDRINMYAIGEIQDCIEEKNSLMELNFNLITLKESSYIEGLTRITILLAKATILFLPISFVTAYFTVEFTDEESGDSVKYNVRQYWITFAVTLFVTLCGLMLFGRLSGTQEGKPIYESFTNLFLQAWRGIWRTKARALGEKVEDDSTSDRESGEIQLQALKT